MSAANSPGDQKKIGLSLSFCIDDILRGEVQEKEVKKIVASTTALSRKDFEDLLKRYTATYWDNNPEGAKIARRLYDADKIEQPRLAGKDVHDISSGHWLSEADFGSWQQEQGGNT